MTDEDKNFSPPVDKAIGQVIVETARDSRALLEKLFGPAVTEFGGMLGDRMCYWRFRNLCHILSKVEEITKAHGFEVEGLSSLEFGDAFRTIEAASFEEKEEVQELWAGLIANAVSPDSTITIKKVYIEILRSLSPAEAALLELLGECERRSWRINVEELKEFNEEMNKLANLKWRKYDSEARRTLTQNLVRIRCVAFRPQPLNVDRMLAEAPRELTQRSFVRWCLIDPERFEDFITQLANVMLTAIGVREVDASKSIPLQGNFMLGYGRTLSIEIPEMNFMLTALGTDLLQACRIDRDSVDKIN